MKDHIGVVIRSAQGKHIASYSLSPTAWGQNKAGILKTLEGNLDKGFEEQAIDPTH